MKIVINILFWLVLIAIGTGLILKNDFSWANQLIGYGVLLLAFVLMPLFIYHRYRGKDLSSYSLFNEAEEKENE